MIRFSPALFILALSGCSIGNANVQGEWDCPAQRGRACTTIEEADSLSNRSTLSPTAVSVAPLPSVEQTAPASVLPEAGSPETAAPFSNSTAAFTSKIPGVRQAEILGKVWFYPFVDDTDNYHEGGFIHVVLRPADWQTRPDHMFPGGDTYKGGNK